MGFKWDLTGFNGFQWVKYLWLMMVNNDQYYIHMYIIMEVSEVMGVPGYPTSWNLFALFNGKSFFIEWMIDTPILGKLCWVFVVVVSMNPMFG